MNSIRIAVVYHSGYGHTARLAQAVAEGADQMPQARGLCLALEQARADWAVLRSADAIVFGTPTYMGGVSAAFKAFMEETSAAVMACDFAWRDKLAAGFTNSGALAGDKLATLQQLILFSAQHGMHWINPALAPANNASTSTGEELNRLGFWIGVGAQSNVDQGPERAPPAADLASARHLGRRVAEVAAQLARGRAAPAAMAV